MANMAKRLKETVFLPKTSFPMRGDLANREPLMVDEWKNTGLFEKLRTASKHTKAPIEIRYI